MATKKNNGKKIFDVMKKTFPVPKVAEKMINFICEHIEEVLGKDVLEADFSLESYAKAKSAYMHWMLNGNFEKKFGKKLDSESMGLWRSLYSQLIGRLEPIIQDPKKFSKETGMTDEILIAKMPFGDEAKKLLKAKKLTIGKLLLVQPAIILDNTGK